MKILLYSLLLLIPATVTSALTTVVQAQTTAINSRPLHTTAYQIQPFNLVTLAYQGYLKQQNIPSYGVLTNSYRDQSISAQQLVQAAVNMNRLPPTVLQDQQYIQAVDQELQNLTGVFY